ncbi:hypothetical protein BVRB_2g033560 [Beta vulgaris subsp. vulgaris]|nr:hypothetical protein BVRB_2g033560 [Beta vulgaris subsp. vulgaris]
MADALVTSPFCHHYEETRVSRSSIKQTIEEATAKLRGKGK